MNKLLLLLMIAVESCFAAGMNNSFPTFFFENSGDSNSEIRFIVNTPELRAGFGKDSVTFEIHGNHTHLRFQGASSQTALEGGMKMNGAVNLLLGSDPGKWRTALSTYQRIVYRGLYSGIDLTYAAAGPRIKAEFLIAPHADPGQIRLQYPEAGRVFLDANGDLVAGGAGAELRERAPEIYQDSAGGRVRVSGRYRMLEPKTVGFEIGAYDASKPLIVDPVVSYATYLGGNGMTSVNGIAADAAGDVYVAGSTEALNFPIQGAEQAANRGGVDVFVAKLSPGGSALLYATYVGGTGEDSASSIAVDSAGQMYVTGFTTSTNFPLLSPIHNAPRSGHAAFVFKLNASGSQFVYSTYFGGSTWDSGNAIAADASGNAYIAGDTQSADLPMLNAYQSTLAGQTDAFVAKFTAGGALSFSTFLGGSGADHAGAIALDASNNIYIGGGTASPNFPVRNAMQAANAGGQDAFLTKMNAGGSTLAYSTYFGGNGGAFYPEEIIGVAIDSAGDAYVAGVTNSANLPVSSGALRTAYNGMQDAFAAEFSPSGALAYSTYLGGSTSNWASSIAVDWSGNAYVAGNTSSVDFPLVNPVQLTFGGFYDAFLSEVAPGGGALNYSTYYGGSGSDVANGVALDGAGNIYVAGETGSSDFPLVSAFETSYGGSATGFVLSLAAPLASSSNPSPANGATGVSTSAVLSWVETGATTFDVYFGTSSTPGYVTTVSTTTYTPGTLISGQTYYWRVVVKNGSTAMSSATWSFAVLGISCSYSITPPTTSVAAAAGTGSVGVSTGTGCGWTAASNASWLTITSGSSSTGSGNVGYSFAANTGAGVRSGTLTIAGQTFTASQVVNGGPLLAIQLTHPGSLAAGQANGELLATVSNGTGAGSTSGTVTVTEVPPSGLTIVSMAGTGWTCSGNTCTRSDVLSGGSSYPAITVTANVGPAVTSPLINTATVSGGGSLTASGSDTSTLTMALAFYPITPCRAVDTRTSQNKTGAFGPPTLAAYSARSFPLLSSGCGIPSTAKGYSLNVTILPPGPVSFVSMWPSNAGYPGVSVLNSSDGSTLANAVMIPAGTDSGGSVTTVAGNPTDLIIDINGYFAPPGTGLIFFPVSECRVVDTRSSSTISGANGPPTMAGYSDRTFTVSGNCGVPSTAEAYSLNFTAIPEGPLSFLSTWPAGQGYPGVSTLNSTYAAVTSNAALVPSGTGGAIIVVTGNPTDVTIDVNGYFGPSAPGGLHFYPVTPCRMVDTRGGQGKTGAFGPPSLVANSGRNFPLVSSGCNIPSTAQVYALNITVVPPGPLSSLTVWATGQADPGLSTVSSSNENLIAIASLMAAGTGGSISIVSGNATDLILDISGYFAP